MNTVGNWLGILGTTALWAGSALAAETIYESGFADGGKAWTSIHNARVSDVARRPGGRSLLIRQTKDEEADSAWLGPVLRNPGGAVRISLWAAENYDVQKDISYAAAFEAVSCDAAGEFAASPSGGWMAVPWDDRRQDPQIHHQTRTREGLTWKHHVATGRVAGDHFRVRLFWPKTLVRGECYFTDVRVTTADDASPVAGAATPADPTANRFALEISTAANGNLFFVDDPLRFEFLLHATDGRPMGDFKQPVLHYDITDYEHFKVAAGSIPFHEANPLGFAVPRRTENRHLSATIPDAAARSVGREFFIHGRLEDDGRVLAEDTVTYAVVDPRPARADDYDDFRFMNHYGGGGVRDGTSKHEQQALPHKFGTSLTHDWDYGGWRPAQPVKGGPITIQPGPDFPKLVYCPNLEQLRHMGVDISRSVPDWALVDDPYRPGRKTFDIDGYVAYIVAYVRANRQRIVQVVPSGLERPIDAHTLELHRKAYAALKREFPDLPVGIMAWGLAYDPQVVDQILAEKLWEVADFFDSHAYLSRLVWTEWERLRTELKKRGVERPLLSTELSAVGGIDQVQTSRDLVSITLDAHAHGMYRINHFNVCTAPSPRAWLRGEVPGDGFQFMQYVDRPRVSAAIAAEDAPAHRHWHGGAHGVDGRGNSLMPLLKATVYYNLVQNLERAAFKCAFKPAPRTVAYVYAREGRTICYLFLDEPSPPPTLALQATVPYVMQDLYGRTDRVVPVGSSLVVATQDPLALLFEGEVPALHDPATAVAALRPVAAGLELPVIGRGSAGRATLTLPPLADDAVAARVEATVDGTWPAVAPQQVRLTPGKPARVELPIVVAAEQPAGAFTFTARVLEGDRVVSVLKQPLRVAERIQAELTSVPLTRRQDPAVVVTLRNLSDAPAAGRVRVVNSFFGAGFEPAPMEQPYAVAPRGAAEIRFPVPRDQVNLSTSYEMRAIVADQGGFSVTCDDDVGFQACVKTRVPIAVDGDLSDWKLDELVPVPFERRALFGADEGPECSGRFYARWDDARLFFAAEIADTVAVVLGQDRPLWNDDNVMLGLYPWTWHLGEPLEGGYYREHLGPMQGGKAAIWRVGRVPSGPATAAGAEIAVRRTATGWVYEWSYPRAAVHPLELRTGNGFRLALSVWEQFKREKKDEDDWGHFNMLTFGGLNYAILAKPDLWRQFRLVEE